MRLYFFNYLVKKERVFNYIFGHSVRLCHFGPNFNCRFWFSGYPNCYNYVYLLLCRPIFITKYLQDTYETDRFDNELGANSTLMT